MNEKANPPTISIIMPTYNRAGFIGETIESIRQQDFTSWELIIVDDGSDDDTEKIVRAIGDPRIIYHQAGRIGIVGKIKNMGIELSRGDFIAFIDSDDLWAPSKLSLQLDALIRCADAGFCLTGGYNFKTKGKAVDYFYKQRTGEKYGSLFLDYFRSELAGFTQALMIRRESLNKTGTFKESKSFSDIDFILSLAKECTGVVLYEPLVYRRLHQSNHSSSNWDKSYYDAIGLIRSNRNLIPSSIYHGALYRLYINFGEKYSMQGKALHAMSRFFQAWKQKPLSIVPLKKSLKALFQAFRFKKTRE
jgi:glycosyltransferase involved in cell wall biosynthesis